MKCKACKVCYRKLEGCQRFYCSTICRRLAWAVRQWQGGRTDRERWMASRLLLIRPAGEASEGGGHVKGAKPTTASAREAGKGPSHGVVLPVCDGRRRDAPQRGGRFAT